MINIPRMAKLLLLFVAVIVYAALAMTIYLKDQVGSQKKTTIFDAHGLRMAFYNYKDIGMQKTFVKDGEYFIRGVVQKKRIGGGGIELKGADFAVLYPALESVVRFEDLSVGAEVVVNCEFRSMNNEKMFFTNCQ